MRRDRNFTPIKLQNDIAATIDGWMPENGTFQDFRESSDFDKMVGELEGVFESHIESLYDVVADALKDAIKEVLL